MLNVAAERLKQYRRPASRGSTTMPAHEASANGVLMHRTVLDSTATVSALPGQGRRHSRGAGLRALAGLAAVLALGLSGCGHLGAPSKVTLSEAELQRLLSARFPVEQRLLELFEVRASSPQLRLLPERNRLSAVLDLQARERILASQYKGRLDFDSALRWDAAEHAVRLDQVRVQDFVLDPRGAPGSNPLAAPGGPQTVVAPGSVQAATATATAPGSVQQTAAAAAAAGGARRTGAERVAAALAERVLEGLVLYRLPADKVAQLEQAGVQPAALTITRSGLEITFAAKAK